jgi:hypothetical protein
MVSLSRAGIENQFIALFQQATTVSAALKRPTQFGARFKIRFHSQSFDSRQISRFNYVRTLAASAEFRASLRCGHDDGAARFLAGSSVGVGE